MDKSVLINDSIDYILSHLEEPITIADVADHLSYSKYYFCRMFKDVTGESVYSFIKRVKLEQSAIDLKIKREKQISQIGLDYGYSASNYSSVFREMYDQSPIKFRESVQANTIQNPFDSQKQEHLSSYEEYQEKIQIREVNHLFVVYKRQIGNYIELKQEWASFIAENAYYDESAILMEKYYSDPSVALEDHSICDLCFTVDETFDAENTKQIEGGRCAVFPFQGAIEDIFSAIQGLFTIWLPQSKYQMSKKYGLNIYRNIDWEAGYVQMDICIPIK
ncbi:AraC family transcriptional regulator [Enterococcus malodoratus]|uniref:AraC family transcriptional regulator n=1 Tax=Enterococcus malodoratus TaxID=71451 RepID=UPI0039AFA4E8